MKKYEKYKASSIDGFGELPESWTIEKVKHLCSVTDGTHFSPQTEPEGKPYITVSNVNNDVINIDGALHISIEDFNALVKQGCQPKSGDVLLTKDGTVGRSAIVGENNDFVCLSSLGIIRPGKQIISPYLKYTLDSEILQDQMRRAMAGSALKRITITKIEEFYLPRPSILEQEAIAKYLDHKVAKIDSSIAAIDAQIADLKTYRQSVISEAVTKGLDKNAPMKDSGVDWIGQIPEGWMPQKGKYIGEITHGVSYTPEDICDAETGILVMRASNIQDSTFSYSDNVYISRTKIPSSKYLLKNDILICATNGSLSLVGKSAVAKEDLHASFGTFMLRFRTKYNSRFIQYQLSRFVDLYRGLFSTTTINQLTSEQLENIVFFIPPVTEQEAIADYLDSKISKADSAIEALEKQKEGLATLKQSIISEAVTGKIDVRDWKPSNE